MSRRSILPFTLVGAGLLLIACDDTPTDVATEEIVAVTPALSFHETGNGALSGPHYNLNIIGVPKEKSADMSQGGGHVIFVGLGSESVTKNTRILLSSGDDFLVLDKNGTDGKASFQLPGDVADTYLVYARALGKPGGKTSFDLCYTDPGEDGMLNTEDDVVECGGDPMELTRTKGKSKFSNVSKTLLYLELDIDPDSELVGCLPEGSDTPEVDDPVVEDVEIALFDECLQGYLWDFNNNGLKLLQLRFYPMPA